MKKRHYLFLAGFLLALNVFCWREVFALNSPKYLKVDFLSVGQGDSEFIQTPQGHQILIDGGPSSAVLEKLNSRLPFFDKSIDVVILTHPEVDHMQGLLDVMQRYGVDYFVWNGAVKNSSENIKLAEILKQKQTAPRTWRAGLLGQGETRVFLASAGTKIKAGDVKIDILSPLESVEGREAKNTVNDTSIVNRIIYGKNSFLFTGDIDISTEKKILYAQGADIESDVLKVAHHGSKYSSSENFLSAVSPAIAIIEVGKNSYGHPTPETLQRLEKFGIKVMRTDQSGDIEIISDGQNIKIKNN